MRPSLPLLVITTLLFPAFLRAQSPPQPDTDFDSSVAVHDRLHINELPIYNGRKHLGYLRTIIGTAYYRTEEWQPGSVLYEGTWYPGLYFKYDLTTDNLILQGISGIGSVMVKSRIAEFWMGGRHFVRNHLEIRNSPGFYEVLAEGRITLIAFHKKVLEEKILDREIERSFIGTTHYFAITEKGIIPIRRQKDLTRLLGDKRSASIASRKSKGLNYKQDPEAVLTHHAQFYNKSAR
ncbi:MAG: hypothetical protein ABWZ25_13125 [Chitinophagaceae bacterium]